MAITQAQAEAQLAVWLAASTAVASGQSYTIEGRTLTRVNASEITKMIDYWEQKASRAEHGGMRIRGATPV